MSSMAETNRLIGVGHLHNTEMGQTQFSFSPEFARRRRERYILKNYVSGASKSILAAEDKLPSSADG